MIWWNFFILIVWGFSPFEGLFWPDVWEWFFRSWKTFYLLLWKSSRCCRFSLAENATYYDPAGGWPRFEFKSKVLSSQFVIAFDMVPRKRTSIVRRIFFYMRRSITAFNYHFFHNALEWHIVNDFSSTSSRILSKMAQ